MVHSWSPRHRTQPAHRSHRAALRAEEQGDREELHVVTLPVYLLRGWGSQVSKLLRPQIGQLERLRQAAACGCGPVVSFLGEEGRGIRVTVQVPIQGCR